MLTEPVCCPLVLLSVCCVVRHVVTTVRLLVPWPLLELYILFIKVEHGFLFHFLSVAAEIV